MLHREECHGFTPKTPPLPKAALGFNLFHCVSPPKSDVHASMDATRDSEVVFLGPQARPFRNLKWPVDPSFIPSLESCAAGLYRFTSFPRNPSGHPPSG
jgi:hypothetical protein